MEGLFNLIGTIVVAIIGLIGIVIQTKSKQKTETIDTKIDALRKESEANDKVINNKLDSTKLQTLKIWLTSEMTKIRDGYYKPNEEQKRLILEAKREYNIMGGDSYVDDMFDELKTKHLL